MKLGGFFIALAFVLAACSGDPQPREPDPAAAPSATSTATPPAMPAQAREDSPEGAAAFVTYWVQVSNYAAATGDVAELSRISSPDCSGCQKYIDLYRDTYEAGGYFKGGEWKPEDIEVEEVDEETHVFARIGAPPGRQLEKRGGTEGPTTPEDTDLRFAVTREPGGSNRVLAIERAAS